MPSFSDKLSAKAVLEHFATPTRNERRLRRRELQFPKGVRLVASEYLQSAEQIKISAAA